MLASAIPPAVATGATPGAEPTAVAVRWSGAPACDASERLRERIARDLPTALPATTLEIVVDGEPGRWHGALTMRGASDVHREIVASDCNALADAVALVAVVALDPFAILERTGPLSALPDVEPTPEPAPDPTPTPDADRDRDPPPVSTAAPARPPAQLHAALRLELGTSAFALPGFGAVVGLAPIVEGARWRVELPVRWSLPRERVRAGVGASLQLVAANPRGCFVPGRGAVGVPLCAGLDVGAMIASGRGDALARRTTAATPWVAATLSVAVRWRVHPRFATWLAIEGAVPFGRPTFHVVTAGDMHHAAPATLLVAIGGEVHFPSSKRARRRTQPGGPPSARVHAHRDARDR